MCPIKNKVSQFSNEFESVYFQDSHKKQEDVHSDLSNDTGTFDSGMGGSVSDTGIFAKIHC